MISNPNFSYYMYLKIMMTKFVYIFYISFKFIFACLFHIQSDIVFPVYHEIRMEIVLHTHIHTHLISGPVWH